MEQLTTNTADTAVMYTEAETLAATFSDVRRVTRFIASHISKIDTSHQQVVNGYALNSAHWILGHLTWAENFLLIKGLHAEGPEISWLPMFGLGTDGTVPADAPSVEEILKTMDITHQLALDNIRNMTPEKLAADNALGRPFGGAMDCRSLIRHAIRHEPMHAGQLSWLLRINGVEWFPSRPVNG